MSEQFDNIDQFFKNELESFSPEVPPMAWDNISEQLNARKSKKLKAFYYKIAAGIALLISAGSIIAFLISDNNSNITPQNFTETAMEVDDEKSEIVTQGNITPVIAIQKSTNAEQSTEIAIANTNLAATNYKVKMVASNNEQQTISGRNIFTINKIAGKKGSVPTGITESNIALKLKAGEPQKEFDDFTQYAKYEEIEFEENTNNNLRWMVGGQAGPQYTYREISSESMASQLLAQYNEKEDGLIAYSGGVNVEFSPVRRLSIQSGIYYSKMGQQKPAELQSSASYSDRTQRWSPNYNESQTASYKIANSTGDIVFTNINTAPTTSNESNQLDITKNKAIVADAANYSVSESISLSQYFEYIEIPLIARYSIIDRKFGIHLLGGVSTNFLVGNSIYLDNQPDTPAGHTENVAPVTYSSTVGFGLGYTMSDKLKLTIEPQLKYYLSNQVENSSISVNPYSLGVMTGIKYMF